MASVSRPIMNLFLIENAIILLIIKKYYSVKNIKEILTLESGASKIGKIIL